MDSTETGPSAQTPAAPSTPNAPNAVSLTPPIPLQEKEMLFTDWGLSDTDNSQPVEATDEKGTGKTADPKTVSSKLPEREREHRLRTKAFEAAFKKAAQQAAAEKAAKEAREEAARKKAEEGSDDDDSDDIEIIDLTGPRLPRLPRPPPPRPPRRTVSNIIESVRASATLRRTSSNPEASERQRGEKRRREEVVEAAVKRKPGRPPKDKTAAKDVKKEKKDAKNAKKDDITLVPEGQRIFAGLSFYYLPNEPFGARRLRINKARQHGVQWVKQLADATHVIVDKQLRWEEVEGYVKKEMQATIEESATEAKWPFLVNETYPLDCIGFRHLLNPEQLRYRVSGWAQAQAKEKEQQEKGKEREKEKMDERKDSRADTSPPNRYLIKPDRKQQARLGTTGQQEHMIRQPRHG